MLRVAHISCRAITCASLSLDFSRVSCLIVSDQQTNHVKCAGLSPTVLERKFVCKDIVLVSFNHELDTGLPHRLSEHADDLEEEVACTLPDFRGVEDFSAEGMPAEQQQEAWEQGRQLLTQLKAFLVERLQVERAAVVSGTAGLSEEETQAMEGTLLSC